MPELCVDGRPVAAVEVADTGPTRRRGLLGRDSLSGALWITPCRQVHTVRMRFSIDVAHVARDGRVLATATLRPGRMGALRWRSRAVVEAEAGRFAEWGLRPGVVASIRT